MHILARNDHLKQIIFNISRCPIAVWFWDNKTFFFGEYCDVFVGVLLKTHFVYTVRATL